MLGHSGALWTLEGVLLLGLALETAICFSYANQLIQSLWSQPPALLGSHTLGHCPLTQITGRPGSVQLLIRVRLFATPWTAAHQASLSITNSQSLLNSGPPWCFPMRPWVAAMPPVSRELWANFFFHDDPFHYLCVMMEQVPGTLKTFCSTS